MPLFMDTHRFQAEMPSDEEIRQAHAGDLAAQGDSGVRFLKYWVSREARTIHCLIEAPDAGTAERIHSVATGEGPGEIYEVDERT